ncbi:fructosamine kinase family protein [Pokkaliibacter sp. CJK22405]|uniref:fructosamine kinase family protein n=1 Tax=Pokkaliibacter sp. CJK22405 TaxID=3384615 RepID=UPI003984FB49
MPTFTKYHSNQQALECEAHGLLVLREALAEANITELSIAEVISVSGNQLVLASIASRSAAPGQMAVLGRGLAKLHAIPAERFGFDQDNYIGLGAQTNGWSQDWGSFFVEKRLRPQISLIEDDTYRQASLLRLALVESRLIEFLNTYCQRPSLVHGDLWSGNVLFTDEKIWLIDPALYYGDREVDLAMTEMFGGFTPEFYQAYDAVLPRSPAYGRKRPIYNLYHYLNHYNLFGNSYQEGCEQGFSELEHL